MKWGSFGVVHFASLAIAALLVVGLYFALKKASLKVKTIVLGVLSFSGIAAIIYNLVTWNSPLEYLPLHLCSLNAMVLPIAVFTRSKTLSNLLLVWSLGALAALVVNSAQAEFVLMSPTFCFYFFPHVLEFAIPILLFKLDMVKKDPKCILSTLLITVVSYTVIHFINLWLNSYCAANQILNTAGEVIAVNYMYSLVPENPLLALFHSIIPYSYWYMYLIFPIVAVYLLMVYLPQILATRKKAIAR
ncbi:MAG: YwaF family protein [Oscillospiraceae bacterium]|nr:YwaF family protein [Oscillospiraceae bacterium]